MADRPQFRDTFEATWLEMMGTPFEQEQREAFWADVVMRTRRDTRVTLEWDDDLSDNEVPRKVFKTAIERHAEVGSFRPRPAELGKLTVDIASTQHPSREDLAGATIRELGAVAKLKFIRNE